MNRPATLVVDNPFSFEPACTVELADDTAVSAVLDRAAIAARAAAHTVVRDRVRLVLAAIEAMLARADDIARDITAMMGKPLQQARNEVDGMALRARYVA